MAEPEAASSGARDKRAFNCPRCESENTRCVKMIHESDSWNAAMSDEPDAATDNSPPERRKEYSLLRLVTSLVLWPIWGILVLYFAMESCGGFLWIFGLTYVVLYPIGTLWKFVARRGNAKWNRDVFPGEYAAWAKQWRCLRCGKVFVPAG